MAGNEWINGVDETDLHRTWIKVVATRNTRERSSRLENMCWRIWHLARKKKQDICILLGAFVFHVSPNGVIQLEWEDLHRLANRRLEREQGRKDVTEDMSEDLSEGEKGDVLGETPALDVSPRKKFQRNFSNLEVWSDSNKEKEAYIIQLGTLHGLVRGENMELGRDSDTGGQIKYVVELAKALAKMPGVYRVDLFTRQIASPEVDWSYGEPAEMLNTGPEDGFWGEQQVEANSFGHVIHGHYADAGDSAALLSGALNVWMVLTGHSLGRNKLEQLIKQARQSKEDINSTYRIMRRIEGEELSLDAAELVITSTKQEIDEQWGLYDGFDVKLRKVLRARGRRGVNCHGRVTCQGWR
ncbi:sporulation-specific protein 2 [Datura stramonium]|uniref:Sporulation-specific protein 2 n=1 Tax=Datura stramonium TaxID=4076 RepID=A0ABS8VK67_DATST|nr:sporulation-specific protein 2 [Datura stramonium]